jgi:hypothetical protein
VQDEHAIETSLARGGEDGLDEVALRLFLPDHRGSGRVVVAVEETPARLWSADPGHLR